MTTFKTTLRTALKRTGYVALACGLPLAVGLQAQTYSSSNVSYTPQYNSQSNPQYNAPNPQYNGSYSYNQNQYQQPVTPPRYKGEGWGKHFVFEGGGGVTAPAAGTQKFANTGFNVLLGGGLRFNDRLSLLAEWNFNRMGVPTNLAISTAQVPGGNEHIWTAMLNPKFDYIRGGRVDGYVIGGGGFSRQLTTFTAPVIVPCGYGYGYGFGYGYGYGGCSGSVNVAHESSNQGMFDAGTGVEFRFSSYSRFKLFVEGRYERFYTPKSNLPPGYNAALVPVTIGVRW